MKADRMVGEKHLRQFGDGEALAVIGALPRTIPTSSPGPAPVAQHAASAIPARPRRPSSHGHVDRAGGDDPPVLFGHWTGTEQTPPLKLSSYHHKWLLYWYFLVGAPGLEPGTR
jgi:hypothetical protein